ncbi:MAG: hypothetical protein ACLFP2_00055 [Candidatus Woesearchaeota archaeon]
MSFVENALINLEQIGIVYLLAFLLVFTIVYAILTKSKILGDKKNFNIAVALVLGMLVILEPNQTVVKIMQSAIPNVSIVLVAILMFLLMVGLMGGEVKWLGNSASGWIAILSAVTIAWIFGVSAGWWGKGYNNVWYLQWMNNSQTVATVIVLLVFGIVIWFVTKEDKPADQQGKFLKDIGELFGKEK